MEAISVPSPPRLVPIMRAAHLFVNPDKSSAAGTLLITWLLRIATSISFPSRMEVRKSQKSVRRPMLPMKMKKKINVAKRQ